MKAEISGTNARHSTVVDGDTDSEVLARLVVPKNLCLYLIAAAGRVNHVGRLGLVQECSNSAYRSRRNSAMRRAIISPASCLSTTLAAWSECHAGPNHLYFVPVRVVDVEGPHALQHGVLSAADLEAVRLQPLHQVVVLGRRHAKRDVCSTSPSSRAGTPGPRDAPRARSCPGSRARLRCFKNLIGSSGGEMTSSPNSFW